MESNSHVKRVHYYHADANVLGGALESPFEEIIPIQAPLSLPAVGGYGVARAEKFSVKGILSFESAHTQVAGSVSKKTGGWTTMGTAVIENLNVLDVFTAERIVAQIATEHPRVGYYPEVTFLGTQFEGVRIAGNPVKIELDLDICNMADGAADASGHRYPKEACFTDKKFVAKVAAQYRQITSDSNTPAWLRDQFAQAPGEGKGHVLCSVVKSVTGQFPGKSYGNILEVPGFGQIFLGELIVNGESFNLSMVRLELGCPTQGKASAARVVINGSTSP
jgi:hypothetical protein